MAENEKKTLVRSEIMKTLLKKRTSIKFQFGFFIVLFALFLVGTIMVLTLPEEKAILTRERVHLGQTLAGNLAAGSKECLLLEDELYAFEILDDMLRNDYNRDIQDIFVTDPNGKIAVHNDSRMMGKILTDSLTRLTNRINFPAMHRVEYRGREILDFSHPVFENVTKKKIGTARVRMSAYSVTRLVESVVKRVIVTSLTILLIGIVAAMFWVRWITRPISALAEGAKIIGAGNLHHRFKVDSRNEIGELASIFNTMTSDLDHAQKQLISKHQLEHEIDLARKIQATLLPERIPAFCNIELAAYYRSAREVGGDYYDFIAIDSEHLGVLIADVSGKSVAAAFLMGITRAIVRTLAPGDTSPARVLTRVNAVLKTNMKKGMFVTMGYMVINVKTLNIFVASAGHNPLFYFRAKEREPVPVNPAGSALGVLREGGGIPLSEERFRLSKGDLLVLSTDGICEAINAKEEFYGDDRILRIAGDRRLDSTEQIKQALIADLDTFYAGAEQSDDITLVLLKITA
ncbi:MAG: SpoIIE family protein phosphatase [Fibrobacterota bacterium]